MKEALSDEARQKAAFITFEPHRQRIVEYRGKRYFLLQAGRRQGIVPANCAHRNGPLQFAEHIKEGRALRCPWHRLTSCTDKLLEKALPAIRSGKQWLIAIAENQDGAREVR